MTMPNPEKVSLDQILRLVDLLSPEEQEEELCRSLTDKIWHMPITIECTEPMPKDEELLDELRKCAQEVLRQSGVTVDELLAEAEKIREERFANDYPDLANAS